MKRFGFMVGVSGVTVLEAGRPCGQARGDSALSTLNKSLLIWGVE
jgi:hypothetical protein